MTAQAAYRQFLAAPEPSLLADDATLSYITTTMSFAGAAEVVKHLKTLRNQIKKSSEEVIDVIEAHNALWIEITTTFEFVTSGAVYLPSLDDNFLADRAVTLTIDHVVRFDSNGKIKSIRQNWDQGSLLKEVEVIGRTGRNWPICNAKDQIAMIKKLDGTATDKQDSATRHRGPGAKGNTGPNTHSSALSLFAGREELQNADNSFISPKGGVAKRPQDRSITDILSGESETDKPVINPKKIAANRPRNRSLHEILGQGNDDDSEVHVRQPAPKVGAGKNFAPNRLFEGQEDLPVEPDSPEAAPARYYRPNPKRYDHFDFADGSDTHDAPYQAAPAQDTKRTSRHNATWDFEDFVTPQKALPTRGLARHQDRRPWTHDDAGDELDDTPIPKPGLPKPRRDAETHFRLADEGDSDPAQGKLHSKRTDALYENNLYDDSASVVPTPQHATASRKLAPIANVKERRKDFDPHFTMTDESPHASPAQPPKQVPEDRKKAVRMMDANWSSYDESPKQQREKENRPVGSDGVNSLNRGLAPEEGGRVYTVAGDGMGGRKGGRGWSIGDSDDESNAAPAPAKHTAGRKLNQHNQPTSSLWNF